MGIVNRRLPDDRGEKLKNGGVRALKEKHRPEKPPRFEKRDINRNRKHVVFTHESKDYSGKIVHMYHMSCDGKPVGQAGVGEANKRLYNVEIFPEFRNQQYGYRLMAFIMNLPDPPTNLIARSTNSKISNEALCGFYGKFGFKRVDHPVHSYYMEYAP